MSGPINTWSRTTYVQPSTERNQSVRTLIPEWNRVDNNFIMVGPKMVTASHLTSFLWPFSKMAVRCGRMFFRTSFITYDKHAAAVNSFTAANGNWMVALSVLICVPGCVIRPWSWSVLEWCA